MKASRIQSPHHSIFHNPCNRKTPHLGKKEKRKTEAHHSLQQLYQHQPTPSQDSNIKPYKPKSRHDISIPSSKPKPTKNKQNKTPTPNAKLNRTHRQTPGTTTPSPPRPASPTQTPHPSPNSAQPNPPHHHSPSPHLRAGAPPGG